MTTSGKVTLSLTASNDKFGVGMTRDLFQDKKDIVIFDKIDKNGNHKLEDFEICDYRDKEAKYYRKLSGISLATLLLGGTASTLLPPYSTSGVEIAATATAAGAAAHWFERANEIDKLTDEYRRQHGL